MAAAAGAGDDETILYKRGNITITSSHIKLACYYFPTASSKIIPFSHVERVEEKDTNILNTKSWGMALDCKVWWHLDWCIREVDHKRKRGIVLHLKDSKVCVGMTPRIDDLDRVRDIIQRHIQTQDVAVGTPVKEHHN